MSLTTDRLLSPSSINGATVFVRSGASSIFGGLRYDPVRRRVLFLPDARAFRRALQYEFVITGGLRAWDGAPLTNPVTVRFSPGPVQTPSRQRVPSLAREVAPLLVARCARAHCHGAVAPAMALDLSSPEAIVRSTVRVVARQRPAVGASVYTSVDPAWGSMMRVDPGTLDGFGRPEYSYLIYKVLGDGPIVGERMPPTGGALTIDEIAVLSDWIAAGAPTS